MNFEEQAKKFLIHAIQKWYPTILIVIIYLRMVNKIIFL
jgi:hypothetical protein